MQELLKTDNIEVNKQNKDGRTAVYFAAGEGKYENKSELIKLLIEKGADPNTVVNENTGQTLLMWVAQNGHNELVEVLIEAGADINTTSIQKMTALNYAINANKLDAIKLFIENGIDPDTVIDKYETTLLMWAARNGHNDLVEALIEAGADINTTSIQKMTALNYAINANNLDAIKLFIENGIDPDMVIDKYETTLLMWAAKNGHNELVEVLIKAGADINKKDKIGESALITACFWEQPKIAKIIINAGGNVNITNNYGTTPLITAVKYKVNDEIIRLLLNASDINISAQDNSGYSALRFAVER